MRRVKKRIWSGSVLEQIIYTAREGASALEAKPRLRFKDEAEREAHREKQGLREFTRWLNANFDGRGWYSTLTFDLAHEVHTFDEARVIRKNFARRLQRAYPGAVFCIVMGRGENTKRIHMHMVFQSEELARVSPEEADGIFIRIWGQGKVSETEHLKEENRLRNGVVTGRDYSGLAAYLWKHWTREQGGQHVFKTRNGVKCDREDAAECHTEYTMAKPPKTPKAPEGYEWELVDGLSTDYGYRWFKWVLVRERRAPGRPKTTT